MTVVGILGIGAAIAVPSFQSLSLHYRASESFRNALMVVNQGRALSQRKNLPVRVDFAAASAQISVAEVTGTAESVRKTVNSYGALEANRRTLSLGGAKVEKVTFLNGDGSDGTSVNPGAESAFVVFCPSSDNYYRNASDQQPACGIGNLVSASVRIDLAVGTEKSSVIVNRALGAVDLKGK